MTKEEIFDKILENLHCLRICAVIYKNKEMEECIINMCSEWDEIKEQELKDHNN